MKNKVILGCLAAATCEILFGLSFIFTKSITAQVSDLALISWRFVTAFLFINLYFLISRRRININGRNLKPLTRIAILNPNIEAEMIDAALYEDLVAKYDIKRIPMMIFNDSEIHMGGKEIEEIVTLLK